MRKSNEKGGSRGRVVVGGRGRLTGNVNGVAAQGSRSSRGSKGSR